MILQKKKSEIVKFIHHFHIIKEMDLNLKEIIGPKKEDKNSVSLFDDYKKN